MSKMKEILVARFGNQPASKAKNLYTFIDSMPIDDVVIVLNELKQDARFV
jgi:hypothetical protein